jgi:hypothetical protein
MAEPFDWMLAKRNPDVARAQRARREAMYRTEIEERAALLGRLGYTKEGARARLAANVRWDFPGPSGPVTAADVDAIVDRVFGGSGAPGRTGARSKSAETKGGTR